MRIINAENGAIGAFYALLAANGIFILIGALCIQDFRHELHLLLTGKKPGIQQDQNEV